jgi:hypothetical protein
MACLIAFSCCGWAYGYCILTLLPPQMFPQISEFGWSLLGEVSVQTIPLCSCWGCRTFQTASYIHVIPIWGVWAPSTVGDGHMDAHSLRYHHRCSPDLGELAEVLGDVSVQTMPLCNDWGCKTFQTESYIQVILIWSVWSPSTVEDGHMDAHSIRYHHRRSPDLGELAESLLGDVSVQTMPLRYGWGCRTFQPASHIHVIPIWGVWATSIVVYRHMATHSHNLHHRHFPRFQRVGWNPRIRKCRNHASCSRVHLGSWMWCCASKGQFLFCPSHGSQD